MNIDPNLFQEIVTDAINYCQFMAGTYSGQVEESLWDGKKELYQNLLNHLTVNVDKVK
jgi:hypothetical protein